MWILKYVLNMNISFIQTLHIKNKFSENFRAHLKMSDPQNMASNVLDNSQENNGGDFPSAAPVGDFEQSTNTKSPHDAATGSENNNNNSGEAGVGTSNSTNEQNGNKEEVDSRFDCNICLEVAKDAVISMCGHLFCWPCLHQWLDTRPNRQLCPVCKSAINKDKVIPLYGRGGGDTDPREKIPPRPQGQRTEETSQGFPGMFQWGGDNGHGGVQFSLGIGVFPISFFASFFNTGLGGPDRRPEPPPQGSRQQVEEQFLSNVFMYIGIVILLWLLLF